MIYQRPISDIKILVVHCSDSDIPAHDDIDVIRQWHIDRGFDDVGYHFLIKKSGQIQIGRSIYRVGAHTVGFNSISIGICLSGKNNFADMQYKSAAKLIDSLYLVLPNLKREYGILPHRFFDTNKTCPNFNLGNILKNLTCFTGIAENAKYL